MWSSLLSLYAITGLDSVSAFVTKGKKNAFDIVQLYLWGKLLAVLVRGSLLVTKIYHKQDRTACMHLVPTVSSIPWRCKWPGSWWQLLKAERKPAGNLLDLNQAPLPHSVMGIVCSGCKGLCQKEHCSCVCNGLPCTKACTCQDICINSVMNLRKVVKMTMIMTTVLMMMKIT